MLTGSWHHRFDSLDACLGEHFPLALILLSAYVLVAGSSPAFRGEDDDARALAAVLVQRIRRFDQAPSLVTNDNMPALDRSPVLFVNQELPLSDAGPTISQRASPDCCTLNE